ncbi:hypothetical protein BH23GEM4_BH23GEM4_17280 [soil metagenome]
MKGEWQPRLGVTGWEAWGRHDGSRPDRDEIRIRPHLTSRSTRDLLRTSAVGMIQLLILTLLFVLGVLGERRLTGSLFWWPFAMVALLFLMAFPLRLTVLHWFELDREGIRVGRGSGRPRIWSTPSVLVT